MSESTEARSAADHFGQLYSRLSELEGRIDSLEAWAEAQRIGVPPGPPANLDHDVLAQIVELETRLKDLENENRELAERCDSLRAYNDAISNLYVVKHRLHASFEPTEIMSVLREILSELIGASEFGIFLLDPRQAALRRVTGLGVESRPDFVAVGDGYLGRVVRDGKAFFHEPGLEGERASTAPLAVIPLRGEAGPIGIIAIWRLLSHKPCLNPLDHQLLELIADQAPMALMSAHLHQKSRARSRAEPAV